jgi:hypothetical protein
MKIPKAVIKCDPDLPLLVITNSQRLFYRHPLPAVLVEPLHLF